MADITMCDNQECKIRMGCYRATAPVSDYQSWVTFGKSKDESCAYYILRVPHTRVAEKSEMF